MGLSGPFKLDSDSDPLILKPTNCGIKLHCFGLCAEHFSDIPWIITEYEFSSGGSKEISQNLDNGSKNSENQ